MAVIVFIYLLFLVQQYNECLALNVCSYLYIQSSNDAVSEKPSHCEDLKSVKSAYYMNTLKQDLCLIL